MTRTGSSPSLGVGDRLAGRHGGRTWTVLDVPFSPFPALRKSLG